MRLKIFILIISVFGIVATAQDNTSVKIMFYNTENYFDACDDTITLDEEFTPEGERHWTRNKFIHKANQLYKVIVAAGGWNPPDLIGLAEVENAHVLNYLVRETPFSKFNYHVIHFDSPDLRGIDVAMLYNPESFTIVRAVPLQVVLPGNHRPTRDILYVKGLLGDSLQVHLFVNHWPSRMTGSLETEALRMAAARTLKGTIDSLFRTELDARIIVMGDFNDEPADRSLNVLAVPFSEQSGTDNPNKLVNLMSSIQNKDDGTLFYHDRWWLFDQFMVSRNLIDGSDILTVRRGSPQIFRVSFLVTKDTPHKPVRTFSGYRYTGGFSDHLPVILDLETGR